MERDMESIMRAVGVEWCAVEVSRGWADDNKRGAQAVHCPETRI